MEFDWIFVFSLKGLLWALAGAVLGIIWGALPGLSVTMAMAMLVGLTYNMPAEVAVIFMIAVWTGAEFGGAITAVLLNIPGTPSAIPTQIAGYPLTVAGQGAKAIGAALTFSMLGNWAGLLVLVLLSPVVISIALGFGSWEMFLLALLGVCISGALAGGGSTIKGWIMGCLGLLFAMIGKDPIYGIERFTFDSVQLKAGVGYLPVLIGLFGLSEVFRVLSQPAPRPHKVGTEIAAILPDRGDLRRYWRSALRSSAIGTVVGAIPGAGANIASYVSYMAGERSTGREFSKGDLEGVVCSEVANNANIGGGLLPTTTLGIPGNSSSALIIAALALHGVILGPTVEQDQPGIMLFLYMALLSANIFMYLCALTLIRPSVYLAAMPGGVIMPVVAMFCLIGTFSATFSTFEVLVMYVAGVAGFILNRQGFPFAPLALGLILGPLADENLRRALLLYEGREQELLTRPIGLILVAGTGVSLYFGVRNPR